MSDNAFLLVGLVVLSLLIARRWIADFRASLAGKPDGAALPGATPAPAAAVAVASLGALAILAAETAGEQMLGLTAAQSSVTVLFGAYSIAGAPVIEELVFRGYLVVEGRGRAVLWAGVAATSLVFALMHPYLWVWNGGGVALQLGAKSWFSTGMVFAVSLWFYAVRLFRLNPERSLLPCFAAHVTKNLGVFAVKYAQGFVGGWW